MSGPKKSFHEYTRWKIATAMITGQDCGMITETERPERAGAIDRRRLVHLARDRHEVLAHQEHVEGVGEERRHEQRQPGPDPAELDEDRVGRDDRHRGGQEDRRDEQQEQQVPAGEPEAGEAVGHERARDERPDHPDDARWRSVLNSSRG